jgi:hypothetical protein
LRARPVGGRATVSAITPRTGDRRRECSGWYAPGP